MVGGHQRNKPGLWISTLPNLGSVFSSELETYKQLSCLVISRPLLLLRPPPAQPHGGNLSSRKSLRSLQSLVFLHVSVTQPPSPQTRLFSWGNPDQHFWVIGLEGLCVEGRSQVWGFCFWAVFLTGREGACLSDSRAPVTHSCSHAPKL